MSKEKNKVYILDEKGMISLKKELEKLKEELAIIQSYIKESAFDRKDLCGIQIDAQSVGRLQFQIYTIEEKLENAVLLEESDKNDNITHIGDVLELFLDFGDAKERMILRLGTIHQSDSEDGIEVISIESDLGKAVYKKKIGTTVSYGKNNVFKAEIIRKVNEMDKDVNKPSQLLKNKKA